MSKLVRDRIPELIEKSGKTPIYYRAKPQDVLHLLKEKLIEETNELITAISREDVLDEAADVYEVVTNILFELGYDQKDLMLAACDKRHDRGAFIKAYILEGVQESGGK